MTNRGAREKGAEYERKIARAFRDALKLERHQCYRTPMSGGHAAASKTAPGDLQFDPAVDAALLISVECKNQAIARLSHLHSGRGGKYWDDWLVQACRAATDNRLPILVARVDRIDFAIWPMSDPELCVTRTPSTLEFERVGRWWKMVPLEALLDRLARRWDAVSGTI